jgi:hypothetical protein
MTSDPKFKNQQSDLTKMRESEAAVHIENPLLEKWRAHAKKFKRLHGASNSFFKGSADMALFTTVAVSLGVGCLNLAYGIGQPSSTAGIPAIVSGCLSLLIGSVAAVNRGLEWPSKAERHNDYSSRFVEVVRDINTECTLRHLNNAKHTSEGDFIRHTSNVMSRLEENAPNIPECIEKDSYST